MTDTSNDPIWPREIWAFERAELEHTGTHVFDVVATVPRWDGDEERERNHQCYIDKDIFNSQTKYYKAQMETLAAERDALQANLDGAVEALEPFAKAIAMYKGFSENQLILLSEDNPKGRRLAHLFPDNFATARQALSAIKEGE